MQSTLTAAVGTADRFAIETIDGVLTVRDHQTGDVIVHEARWGMAQAVCARDTLNAVPARVALFTWGVAA